MKTILVDAINTFVIKGGGVDVPLFELLEGYPHRKIILTNANDEQMGEMGLTDMPYEVFSLKHNPEKTDPAYYQKMLERFALQVADVLYIEHNRAAVKSAESIGIKTHHYDAQKKDLSTLKLFLDQNL